MAGAAVSTVGLAFETFCRAFSCVQAAETGRETSTRFGLLIWIVLESSSEDLFVTNICHHLFTASVLMIQPQEAAGGEGPEHGSTPLFTLRRSCWRLVVTTGQQQRPQRGCRSNVHKQVPTSNV